MAKTELAPADAGPAATLRAWAEPIFLKERNVSPRVAIVRGGRVQEFAARPLVGDVGVDGLVQAAAILTRTAADDELVAVFAHAQTEGKRFGVDPRTGLNPGVSAILLGRSRDGETVGRLFRGEVQAGRSFRGTTHDLTVDQITGIADWTDSLLLVDPELDGRLAGKRFPGAMVHAPQPVDPMALIGTASNAAPATTDASPRDAARAVEPIDPDVRRVRRVLSFPWEAARAHAKDLLDISPAGLGTEPFAWTGGGAPANIRSRPLAELLRNGWRTEMQAVQVATQLSRATDLRVGLRAVLSAPVPSVAKAHACMITAFVAFRRDQRDFANEAAQELVARIDTAVAASGGDAAWFSAMWPDKPGVGAEIGTVWIACTATAAYWRLAAAMTRPVIIPPPDDSDVVQGMRIAKELRDRILDRAGASGSSPGARLVDLGRLILGTVPSELGEPRLKRWLDAALAGGGRQTPERTLRDFAGINAVVLHTIVLITELILTRADEVEFEGVGVWRPEDVPLEGLHQHGRIVLARHHVHRATLATSEGEMLTSLERAAAVSDGDETIAACFNEARYRAGRLDDRLLVDVTKEAGKNHLAATEMLRVAERLGRRREAKVARKWLENAARKSPHRWIAEVRIAFGRPDELADPRRIRELERGDAPANLDPRERAVFALYGAEPDVTVANYRRALAAQREAIEWARQLAEERAEEALTAPSVSRERPEVPLEATPGAATHALAALRYRLDRPKMARHPLKSRLEAQARRAAELANAEDPTAATPWLEALGDSAGLVARLDAAIREADAPRGEQPTTTSAVGTALSRADVALEVALSASWCSSFQTRLRSVWPLLAQVHDDRGAELARDAADLQRRGELASDAEVREAAERDLGTLLERAQDALRTGTVEESDGTPASSPASAPAPDDFRQMVIPERALERSRRDLDTPEWAITEGIRQVGLFNLTGGKRDRKMLRGTRVEGGGAFWELRRHDGRGPLRVMYILDAAGPRVAAILAKQDEAHQRRMIDRVVGWEKEES